MNLYSKTLLMEWKTNSTDRIRPTIEKVRHSSRRCMAATTLEEDHLINKECLSHI